jgi:putative ABC transport system permease protein
LRRSPGFTAVALIVLALGIGITSAMFSFVDAVLLKPLAYKNPEQLVMVWERDPQVDRSTPPPPMFREWRAQNQVFSHMAAYTTSIRGGDSRGLTLTGRGPAERIRCMAVSASYFDMLGVLPTLGRTFREEEEQVGKEHVVILSNRFWRRTFGADPNVLGRAIELSDEKYTVVGVLPGNGIFDQLSTDAWIPLAIRADQMRWDTNFFRVLARLKPGVTLQQANAEMSRITEEAARQGPAFRRNYSANVMPLRDEVVQRDLREVLLLLQGAVSLILLIACVNVANLLLARGASREREVAIRAALGAGRLRLLRQFLTESLLLAALGGGLGLLVAAWLLEGFTALMPKLTLPQEALVALDYRVVLFTAGVSLATGILFGLAPAWQATSTSLSRQLRPHRSRLRNGLLVWEIALTFLLVIGAGLLIRSFARLLAVDPGMETERILTVSTDLWKTRYPQAHQIVSYQEEFLRRIRATPGVKSAAVTNALPLTGNSFNNSIYVAGRRDTMTGCGIRPVSPDYFRTLGIRLLKGRLLSDLDDSKAPPAAVINETLARHLWPDAEPIGGQIQLAGDTAGPFTVVGVVADVKHSGLAFETPEEIYLPIVQMSGSMMDFFARPLKFVIRAAVPPAALAKTVQTIAASVDKDQPLFDVQTMEQIFSDSVAQPRFRTLLFGLFGALALVLAAVGIYGVLYYSVARRTQEIGIRMAMGAQVRDVLGMVLRQGMALAAAGVLAGVCGALALTRLLASFLFAVKPTDVVTFAGVTALVMGVALAACYFPARRAARVDPMVALRYE